MQWRQVLSTAFTMVGSGAMFIVREQSLQGYVDALERGDDKQATEHANRAKEADTLLIGLGVPHAALDRADFPERRSS